MIAQRPPTETLASISLRHRPIHYLYGSVEITTHWSVPCDTGSWSDTKISGCAFHLIKAGKRRLHGISTHTITLKTQRAAVAFIWSLISSATKSWRVRAVICRGEGAVSESVETIQLLCHSYSSFYIRFTMSLCGCVNGYLWSALYYSSEVDYYYFFF